MKRILTIAIMFIFSANLYAQEISEVTDMKKRKAAKAEVEAAIDREIQSEEEFVTTYMWLMETPIHLNVEKRQIVNAAISNYIEENPEINIDPDIKLLKFAEVTPELLPVFMGGYAIYVFDNENPNPVQANVAGAEKLIEYYENNREFLEKNRQIEKLIRKEDKDKLEQYIERKTK
ncbi:MAG: hypothetical protein ACNS60_03270 [Candidatus Cyclobacteriaceae bacterium M2_1C_046]